MNSNPPTRLPAAIPWTAVVLDLDCAVFANAKLTQQASYVPPGLLYDPSYLVDQLSAMFRGEGTVLVPMVPGPYDTPQYQAMTYPQRLEQMIEKVRTDGWIVSDVAAENSYGWVSFRREGWASVHLGISPHITPGKAQLVDVDQDSMTQTAQLLARYHEATGTAWRSTAGVAGVQMIRAYYDRPLKTRTGERPRKQPRWVEQTAESMTGAGDIMWFRRRTPQEAARAHVVQYDLRMAYGAAAGIAELPTESLTPSGACEFDPLLAGYWRVIIPPSAWWARNNTGRPPIICPSRITGTSSRTAWLTTPILQLLDELGEVVEVIDSATTDATSRLLRPWYERLRDARIMCGTTNHERLGNCVKQTANEAVGMMRSGRGRIQRRIWADTIIDLSRVNQLRKLHEAHDGGRDNTGTGLWPFRVEHDSAWFAVDDIEALSKALQVGPRMGRYRIEQVWTMAEFIAEEKAKKK